MRYFNCGKVGHMRKDCREPAKEQSTPVQGQQQGRGKGKVMAVAVDQDDDEARVV